MRATIYKAEGLLSKYWCQNADAGLAKSMIFGINQMKDLEMLKEKSDHIQDERVIDFDYFSEKHGTDYKLGFSPLEHFNKKML